MKYEIKMFEDNVEIEIDDLPDDYVRGVIEAFRAELTSRERMKRVFSRIGKDVIK